MNLQKFTFKAKHDSGSVKISTVATSEAAAIEMISRAENCPKSALKLISIKPINN